MSAQPTEDRILAVASRLFYERGYHATTMRDLADAVGIKAASVYHHFPGKQDILERICLDGMRDFYDAAIHSLSGVEGASARLRSLITWQVTFEASHPYTARVVDAYLEALNPVSRNELITLRDQYEALVIETLIEGCEQGAWKLSNPRIICLGIVGMCKIDAWYKDGGVLKAEQIGEMYALFILNALKGGHAEF
jgi:AcrR family transcriptional regulator